MPKRIILKLSGEIFKSDKTPIDMDKVRQAAEEIIKLKKQKFEIGLVIGGGNIYRGRGKSGRGINLNTKISHFTGMTGTIVNALAIKNVFDMAKIPNRIISALKFPDVIKVIGKKNYNKYFKKGEIIIFAGGTGRPFVTTDSATVERAIEIKADIILKGTNIDGVYNADPKKNSQVKKYDKLSYKEYNNIKKVFIFDKKAVKSAEKNNLPIYIFKWQKGSLAKAAGLKANGTLISNI